MDDLAFNVVEILRKHMRDSTADIGLDTHLANLQIESLDLAMVIFDLEETFGIEIPYTEDKDVESFSTVGAVVDRVRSLVSAKKVNA